MKKFLVLLFATLGLLAGCNGGSSRAISVSASSSSTTVEAGGTAQITATISNDSSNQGVTWAVTCSTSSCGTVSPTSSTTSPFTTTYTAPSEPPSSTLTVTIKATSIADSTKSASVTITVPAASVTVSPSSATVEAAKTMQFTATVNGLSNTGVTWALDKGTTACSPTCGTLSSSTANPVTYTAPATAPPSDLVLTLTATADADSAKSASATITVPAITVSVSPSVPTVLVDTTEEFKATVANDPSSAGVEWSLAQGGTACEPTCGSLDIVSSTSVIYKAPATLPTSPTVTLTATSLTDGTKTDSATITLTTSIADVCGTGNESLLNGHYAFLLKGYASATPAQPALVGGVITADGNGNVTAGTMDVNLPTGVQTGLSVTTASSSYRVGPDNRGCMTLTTSAGTQDYRFSLGGISTGVASTGHMVDFDETGPFTTGVLHKQDTTAFSTNAVSGHFAFGVSSRQNSSVGGGKLAVVGVIYLSAGTVTGGAEDVNFNGQLDGNSSNTDWPASPIPITGGTYTGNTTSGRGTMTITSAGTTSHYAVYVVSSSKVLIMSIDNQTTNGITAGTALKQAGGSFSASWLNGTGVFYDSGLGIYGSASTWTEIGTISGDGSGDVLTIDAYENLSGSFDTWGGTVTGPVFTINPTTGRVLFHPELDLHLVFYAVNTNEGFLLYAYPFVFDGFMQPQSGTFSASSVMGTLATGTINPDSPQVREQSGVITFDGVSNVTGTIDNNSAGTLEPNHELNETYSIDSNGLAHIPSGCTVSSGSTTCHSLVLFITPTKAVEMDVDPGTTNPAINPAGQ